MREFIETYAREIQTLLEAGATLKEINKWSFEQRKIRDIPYLAIGQTDENGIEYLEASPTASQKTLKVFFSEKAAGSVLPRFVLRVTRQGVEFRERLGKGKDNFVSILAT